ncbi:DNA polymerase-3 subunit gamma/tau [Microlunatus parietis]|uniref:DNA polymerase III subunit gamma/tau n=1 Tax=Microlunatus parietis TaxID=682979 RepID=A0A7Y9LCH1_9ACTN|nr:DNA polymerase-3 subunit gamma/tau [Microlunatus parietis]
MDEAGIDEGSGQDEVLFDEPAAVRVQSVAQLALYRRYRPDTFADVIGQDHVTAPLQRALTNNRVNHAYLFSGPRGCGKTTSARILARALNCEQGPIAEPCGECRSCRDLATGGPGSIDVIEIDAASHGGVDDARDLRERAFFSPVSSRYKIYIVDEAHMVTTAGFNALLKLVEEPPPHVKFIFATTEPEKVIGTIRSRTHHYPFRLVPPKTLSAYLAKLCEAEGIAVEPAVLPLVVRAGAGSVRDSLSVLDQLLGGADATGVSYGHAAALLGYTPDSLLDEFLDAFAAGDAGGVFSCVDKVIEVGQDPRRFAEDLLRRLRDLVIVAAVPNALSSGLVDVSGDQAERLASQAAALGPGELTRAAEVIAVGLTDMRGTTAPRLHLELMCARVLLPGADVDDRGVHARLDRLERRIGMGDPGAPAASPAPAPQVQPAAAPAQAAPAQAAPTQTVPTQPAPAQTAAPQPAASQPAASQPPPTQASPAPTVPSSAAAPGQPTPPEPTPAAVSAPPPAAAPEPQPPGGLAAADVRRLWPEVLEEIKGKRRFTWILLSQNAQVIDLRDNVLVLGMTNAGARDSFTRGGNEDILSDALVQVLGAELRVEAIVDPGANPGGGNTVSPPPAPPAPPAAPTGTAAPVPQDGPSNPGPPAAQAPSPAAPEPSAQAPDSPAADWPTPASLPGSSPGTPVDQAVLDRAREQIRPTRRSGPAQPEDDDAEDDRDAAANRDDTVLIEDTQSHTELLQRHLGAEIIAEEPSDAAH